MNAAAQAATGRAPGERRPSIKLGVLLAIASEGMIFAGLVSGYLVFRTGATDWPPLADRHKKAPVSPGLFHICRAEFR